MKAIRFQSNQRRQLPCYGNLELPFKIKQDNCSAPQFIVNSIQTEDKGTEVKVKEERKERERERDKEKERDKDKERER